MVVAVDVEELDGFGNRVGWYVYSVVRSMSDIC